MRIQYCSDLHLEFLSNSKFLYSNLIRPSADILVLAGDIYIFGKNTDQMHFFDYVSENFKAVYWLAGNHEYYGSDVVRFHKFQKKQIRHNIHIVDDEVVKINDVNLIFSTLWSKISPINEYIIENSVSDFFRISIDGKPFKGVDFNRLHTASKSFITTQLKKRKFENNVVVTHHVPTFMNYPEQYKSSNINEAFAVELSEIIETYNPSAWIYGHSHVNTPEFEIGKTKMVTNQLGYVDSKEHHTFRLDAFIDV